MSLLINLDKLLTEYLNEGKYTLEECKYLYNLPATFPTNKKNNLEFLLNVIDLYDQLKEQTDISIQNIKEKNEAVIDEYIRSGDIFSTPLILYVHSENQQEVMLMKGSDVGTKGITSCRRCHLDNISFYSKQKSKGDEGESLFLTCLDCGYKWWEK
jgi:DNA-directed RNA polymerase subunit M/transcription elongation factor TFIIS